MSTSTKIVVGAGRTAGVQAAPVLRDPRTFPQRQWYRERLAAGSGYDEQHRELLRQLQTQQATHRNKPGGYWIAEADPNAAAHALISRHSTVDSPWAMLVTDGAYNTLEHLGLGDWDAIVHSTSEQLGELLQHCRAWEATQDPQGQELPRSKRHDDKTIAIVRWA